MCSPVQLHECVRVFALACHSLKDDHSIVNKQDIYLKSCITSRGKTTGKCAAPCYLCRGFRGFHRNITT